jgi:hypothetical protein
MTKLNHVCYGNDFRSCWTLQLQMYMCWRNPSKGKFTMGIWKSSHFVARFRPHCQRLDVPFVFLEKPLNERRTLLSNCDDININIETLLFGNDKDSYDVNKFNNMLLYINNRIGQQVIPTDMKSPPYKIYTWINDSKTKH